MASDEDDILEGAAVGETRTVTREDTFHSIDYEPREFWGTDRISDVRIADIEIVDNENGTDDFKVVWEAEVTKTLPRNWDSAAAPRTEEDERRDERRSKMVRAASFGVTLTLAAWITDFIMSLMAGDITVNGEPFTPPPMAHIWLMTAGWVLLAWVIKKGLEGGFPGKVSV